MPPLKFNQAPQNAPHKKGKTQQRKNKPQNKMPHIEIAPKMIILKINLRGFFRLFISCSIWIYSYENFA